ADMIWDLLQRLPFPFHRVPQADRPARIQFKSSNQQLYEALIPFGRSGDKRVPAMIKHMSAGQIEQFLYWYALGDGHFYAPDPMRMQYSSKSHGMIDGIQELLLRTGKTGSVQTNPDCARIETRLHKREIGRGYQWYGKLQPHHRTTVPFDDEVFCV